MRWRQVELSAPAQVRHVHGGLSMLRLPLCLIVHAQRHLTAWLPQQLSAQRLVQRCERHLLSCPQPLHLRLPYGTVPLNVNMQTTQQTGTMAHS